jgi:hypothetical protein
MILMSFAVCQQPSANDVLVNQSVVDMVKAGIPGDIIISKIQTSPAAFDLSTNGLVSLGKQKVPSDIVKAMLQAQGHVQSPQGASAAAESADPNSPDSPHEAGIYIYSKTDSGPTMTMLEPTVYTQGKSGGVFASAMTYGIAKVKWKAVVRGAKAQARSNDPSAVFYFYFEKTSAGLSNSSYGTSTPNEFTIMRFDVKGDSRETVVMQANAFGSSSGSDEKRVTSFDFVKLRPGVYKVTPKAPLVAGEYGIIGTASGGAFAPGATSANRVFDFGINEQR